MGRAYGEADLAHDVRLACHGLDTHDNDFVIGLVGRELHPLSHLVQAMRQHRADLAVPREPRPLLRGPRALAEPRAMRRPRGRRRARALLLLAALVAPAGCASLPPARQVTDIALIAGRWQGQITFARGSYQLFYLTIKPDGPWSRPGTG